QRRPLDLSGGKARLRELVTFRDQRNLYWLRRGYLQIEYDPPPRQLALGIKDLPYWHAIWQAKDTGSRGGQPLYQAPRLKAVSEAPRLGAGVRGRAEDLRGEDLRLQPGSPGKGAGEGGRDTGATVELVGPGPAYDYWRRTPDYQEWLKATGQ